MDSKRGITLIALVITIIVLLILAGVSLSLIAGSDGILGKASTAVDKTKKASAKEELELAVSEVKMGYYETMSGNLRDYMIENLNGYQTGNGNITCDESGKVIYTGNNETVSGSIDAEGNFEFDKIGLFLNLRNITLKIESETMPTETITANLMEISGEITWTSSDPSVATVTGTGANATITGVSKGTTTITAECGDYSDTCTVTVKKMLIGLEIGSEVTYSPSGTYTWQAEYAAPMQIADVTLSSETGNSFQITKWRVLDIDEKKENVKMVPATLLQTSLSNESVELGGAQGYNNAVKLLDDACKELYSSDGVSARSIKIEDIEELLTKEAIEERNNYANLNCAKYGERHKTAHSSSRNDQGEFVINKTYPVMYEREKDNIIKAFPEIAEGKETNLDLSEQTQFIEQSEGNIVGSMREGAKVASISIHPKQTYYKWQYEELKTKFKEYAPGRSYESIILPKGESTHYWIASRCIDQEISSANFKVHYIMGGNLDACLMCTSSGNVTGNSVPLFPVVSLSSELISGDVTNGFVVE